MNTQIIAPVQFVVKTRTAAEHWAAWHEGFRAFCKGASLADLTDPDEIRGWWAALDGQAYAETSAYLVSQGSR
jgi:hypothetical protein